jgi:EAL and modified HD-GYP domain-containing signal transduction protein
MPAVSVTGASSARQTRFLARQPILDARQNVVAYELLFRSGWENVFQGDQEDSTRQILDNILVMGAEGLSSNTLAFVNCTREALVGRLVTLLPPKHTVLEVLETVEPDEAVVSACKALRAMGYRLALDDFFVRDGMEPLIELAEFIKIDFRASDAAARRKIRSLLHGRRAKLVAEKIEDETEFAAAVAEGYDYFQGYFFCHPTVVARDEVRPSSLNYLRMILALSRSPLDQDEIVRIVSADVPFCFRLLRLANSPIHGLPGRIAGVRRALILVGEHEFRKLATVTMAGTLGEQRPHALLALSLQRARFCELLAPHLKQDPTEQYLLGLLSLVDAVLQTPMEAVADLLPLRDEIRSALLGEANGAAVALSIHRCYETGDWEAFPEGGTSLKERPELLDRLYLESVNWAETLLHPGAMKEGPSAIRGAAKRRRRSAD